MEPALLAPDKRHQIRIGLSLQPIPASVAETIATVAAHKDLAIDLELGGVIRVLPGAGDGIINVARHLGKIEREEQLDGVSRCESSGNIVGVPNAIALPVRGTYVEGYGVTAEIKLSGSDINAWVILTLP